MTRLFVCAGEASGDRLGAVLLEELEARDPRLAVRGLPGPRMRERGVTGPASAEDVSTMGLVEALFNAPRIARVIRHLEAELVAFRPDLVVTIDSPGMFLRFARRARSRGFRVVHWVSPQVWAWRPGRVDAVARSVDALLCLFPMEPPLYAGTGLDVIYTGHPAVEWARPNPGLRRPGAAPVFGLAPGSRASEIRLLWPVFRGVAEDLRRRIPECRFVVPVAPTVDRSWLTGIDAMLVDDMSVAGSMADAFLTCSGTATLELAAQGTPMVVIYRVHPITYALARWLVRGVKHVALPNVLAGREIVPEYVQRLDPVALADRLCALLGAEGDRQRQELARIVEPLGGGAVKRAADAIEGQLAARVAR